MTPRYPGAYWMSAGKDQGPNNGPTTVSFHGCITNAGIEGVRSYVEQENTLHGYVAKDGTAAQYKDFDRIAYGMLDGNERGGVTWETWDGLNVGTATYDDVNRGADARPEGTWTDEECERIADIIAWDAIVLGIPARTVTSTRDRAHGMHGHGIPSRATSGEGPNIYVGPDRWSKDNKKPCPGNKRIAQWPGIIRRSQVIEAAVRAGRCGFLPQGPVDLRAALSRTAGGVQVDAADWMRFFVAAMA
ncbi:hypothetical protein FDO65_10165 [Nakamurella flava]|uniref:N-acetylmuramoyl-L-alanine amidase n=1 Tax=Nakamurella flava TaxID=2576308 RepID=A0A4U6QN96_9ACTN|nr:hypothetical protein [Nakamurella flava]TKV61879.1 hypothetical protein FDO65_10165 [Nakamurella flava]